MDSWLKKSNDNGNKPTADDVEATVEVDYNTDWQIDESSMRFNAMRSKLPTFIHAYRLRLCALVFYHTGPLWPVDCSTPPCVYLIKSRYPVKRLPQQHTKRT